MVVSDGDTDYISQVVISQDGTLVTQEGIVIPQQDTDTTYTATLQVNEGTKEAPSWVAVFWISDDFTSPPMWTWRTSPSRRISRTSKSCPWAGTTGPPSPPKSRTQTARPPRPSPANGPATGRTSPPSPADEDDPLTATVIPANQSVGEVTFTFTADNGTPDNETDDKEGSITYTVVAGDSPALTIPSNASTIVTRRGAGATVLRGTNASSFTQDAFDFTIELYAGDLRTEEDLEEQTPVQTYTADSTQNSFAIPGTAITELSENDAPGLHRPGVHAPPQRQRRQRPAVGPGLDRGVSVPAKAVLTPPTSLYLKDTDGTVDISWAVKKPRRRGRRTERQSHHPPGAGGQQLQYRLQ